MNCEEAVRKLFDCLNDETANPTPEQIEQYLGLCKQVCNSCQLQGQTGRIMRTIFYQQKASPELKNKILKSLQGLE